MIVISKRINRSIVCIVFVFFVCLFAFLDCKAFDKYGYDVELVPKQKIEMIWEYHNITIVENEMADRQAIVNFAVSTDDYVAILTTDDMITIFDENGNVYRRFEFYDSGTTYVGWNEKNVLLFSVRGNNVIEFTLNGDLVDVVELSRDYGISIWDDVRRTSVNTTSYTYGLSKNMGGLFDFFSGNKYSTLTKTDGSGNTITIYDVNSFQITKSIIIFMSIIIVICIVPVIIVCNVRKYKTVQIK